MPTIKTYKRLVEIISSKIREANLAIIIRGPQGTGKTTLAKELLKTFRVNGRRVKWVETDMFFTNKGVYNWDREKLPVAHQWCRDTFNKALDTNIITMVANVSKSKSSVKDYTKMCKDKNVPYIVIRMHNIHPNQHNVPEECVLNTAQYMENIRGEFNILEDFNYAN